MKEVLAYGIVIVACLSPILAIMLWSAIKDAGYNRGEAIRYRGLYDDAIKRLDVERWRRDRIQAALDDDGGGGDDE